MRGRRCGMVGLLLLVVGLFVLIGKTEGANNLSEDNMKNLFGGATVPCAKCNLDRVCGTQINCAYPEGQHGCYGNYDCDLPEDYKHQGQYKDCNGGYPNNSCPYAARGCGEEGKCNCDNVVNFVCYDAYSGYQTYPGRCD